MTKFVLTHPTIKAGKYYRVGVYSINCSLQSEAATIRVTSGNVPAAIVQAPYVFSYDSTEAMTVKWTPSANNGGFSITKVTVYVDNSPIVELN